MTVPTTKHAIPLSDLVTKTVYSLIYPETRDVTKDLAKLLASGSLHAMYEEPWTKKQDDAHVEFFDRWLMWSKPVLDWNPDHFIHRYPSAGSSEALREAIAELAIRDGALHIFEGEYEGYERFAATFGVPVRKHRREIPVRIGGEGFKGSDIFLLSHPSAIDGNIWPDYDQFMHYMAKCSFRVWIDLCYVGAVARDYQINLAYPNIERVFFSLSKVFGVYYHRIGGVLSRTEMPGLFGNMWFKNLFSLKLGEQLMAFFNATELPKRYQFAQSLAVARIAPLVGKVSPSDVVLLGHQPKGDDPYLNNEYGRGMSGTNRYCLTRSMDELVRHARQYGNIQ